MNNKTEHIARRLPWRFHAWWGASTANVAGDSMLAFALIWTATGLGTTAVAVVSTLAVLPRVVFLLIGGALGDRLGPRSTLLIATTLQLVILISLATASASIDGLLLLAIAAGITSLVSAFQQPASVVYPRLLIKSDEQLPRALARISGSLQLARIIGVAAAGVMIGQYALTTVFLLAATGVLFTFCVLVAIKPLPSSKPTVAPAKETIWRSIATGVVAAYELGAFRLLLSVALVCAAVLPTVAVVLPSLARARQWSAGDAAMLEATWAAGVLMVTLIVSFTGTFKRPRKVLISGPLLASSAFAIVAISWTPLAGAIGTLVLGIATALFTTHIAPMLILLAPKDQMIRFQSLLTLVQLTPPAIFNAPYAAVANGPYWALAPIFAGLLTLISAFLHFGKRRSNTPATPT